MEEKSEKLADFDIPEAVLNILNSEGITQTYPPQSPALHHALTGKNLVVAIPTASGKSLIAYLAILRSVLAGGKALYIVPLRALATEKFEDLKKFESLGITVELSMGDLDSPDPRLSEFDIIVATSEKTDSLLRHRATWLKEISIIIADEIHLINDPHRGPTLELILARFKQVNQSAQIIGLSATIQNSAELALWLNAEHIKSDWRPVQLTEGVYFEGDIKYIDNSTKTIPIQTDDATSLTLDTIRNDGQVLIFVNSRRSTEAVAKRLAKHVENLLTKDELKDLEQVTKRYKTTELEGTSIASELMRLIRSGVAFHHAGLADNQRKLVENNFRSGLIKCIAATPTLAAGINLPARRVVIRDVSRYDVELGVNAPVPILEIKQMMGRAGRPKYDTIGEAILIAKVPSMVDELRNRYILTDTEPIYSKLSIERSLRTHILAAIASDFVKTQTELEQYIGNSFYAHQKEYYEIASNVDRVLDFLNRNELIFIEEDNDHFTPTEFGRRTSGLYLDPESAVIMKQSLEDTDDLDIPPLAYLHVVCATPDMLTFYLRRNDYGWLEGVASEHEDKFMHTWPSQVTSYDDFLSQVKTACMLEDWIEERSEEFMEKKYNIGPGDIRNKVETGRWLLYSMTELSRMFDTGHTKNLFRLSSRIRYGISEELLELVSLAGIGRVRARSLFKHGYTNKSALSTVPTEQLARIPSIGPTLAEKIKNQL